MALKIVKGSEPLSVEKVIVTIYGAPSTGKTSYAYTASKPLLLDFDNGNKRAVNRGDAVDIVRWSDVDGITPNDLKPYETVIIDTAGNMVQSIITHIENNMPQKAKNGMLLYGEVSRIYHSFVSKIKSAGLDLVFISHFSEEKKGDSVITRLDIAGGKTKNNVYQTSDLLGCLIYEDGKRLLNFNPVDGRIAKNTGNFPVINIADKKLSEVIAELKSKMSSMSAEQVELKKAYDEAVILISEASKVEDFNALLENKVVMNNKELKSLLNNSAKENNLSYDKDLKSFVAAPVEPTKEGA